MIPEANKTILSNIVVCPDEKAQHKKRDPEDDQHRYPGFHFARHHGPLTRMLTQRGLRAVSIVSARAWQVT